MTRGNSPPDRLPPPPAKKPVGLRLLAELAPEDDGWVLNLWLGLRRIHDRVDELPEPRESGPIFLERDPYAIITDPSAPAAQLATGLLAFARISEERGYLKTAALCAELAAYVSQVDPHPAVLAGRLARRVGEYDRAEMWYMRGASLSRRARAWEVYVQALLWHGFLYFQQGDHEAAERKYRSAGRAAVRYGRRSLAAVAHHNLLTIASDLGNFEKGVHHARKSLKFYPVHHPRIPHFIHDVAFLLARNRFFPASLLLFEGVYPHITAAHERIVVVGNIARAAGGARQQERFTSAVSEIHALASISEENSSRGMLGAAEGAYSLGLSIEAVGFAEQAIEIATRRSDGEVLKLARELIERIYAGAPAPEVQIRAGLYSDLVEQCLERLRRWTGRPRGRAVTMLRGRPD